MPRPLRDFRPGRTYLVSQQGNKQISVYVDDEDRDMASQFLLVCSARYKVEVVAWGFGEFEGRWLLRPSTTDGISNLMRDMQSGYSRHLNHKYEHRPCCGKRRLAGAPPCHSSRSNSIRNSSNWTPRFKMTEIADDCLGTAIDLVKSVEIEHVQSGRVANDQCMRVV